VILNVQVLIIISAPYYLLTSLKKPKAGLTRKIGLTGITGCLNIGFMLSHCQGKIQQ